MLGEALERIIGELLISREAERVRVLSPTPQAVERERRRIAQEAGGEVALSALLDRLGASTEEIAVLASRRAMVSAFLQANLEGTTIVTDAELARAYEAEEHPFRDRPFEEVTDELRALLARRALERAVRRWVTVLRARTIINVLVPYGSSS
jgi:hypothetical protein